MARHVTYRGQTIDMDALRREHETTTAIGNMKVNARGDRLARGGEITKTAEQLARENHRVQSTVVTTGLKGPVPDASGMNVTPQKVIKTNPAAPKTAKVTETELPSGDIIVKEEK